MKSGGRGARFAGVALIATALTTLLLASSAFAAYEQVGYFAGTPTLKENPDSPNSWSEEVQLGGTSGMAVNYTGAGGVPAGTIYAVTSIGGNLRVARFNPDGSFSEVWTSGAWNYGGASSERCGPEGEPAHPTCVSNAAGGIRLMDLDVDQTTGDVYVYDGERANFAGEKLIHVYSADGSRLIAEFGEASNYGEPITESPGKLHYSGSLDVHGGSLSVDAAGDVYVFDDTLKTESRIAEFAPQSPGDYEHYEYAGDSHVVGRTELNYPQLPVFDAAGDLYTASEGLVWEYEAGNISGPPICEYAFPKDGVLSMTVDPANGEVFFFSYKDKLHIHRLKPCTGGHFIEGEPIAFSPRRGSIGGLAFDPVRRFAADRPSGVLYVGSSDAEGGEAQGGLGESSLGYMFAAPREVPPAVASEAFGGVTAGAASLSGLVNPEASVTSYAFQYEPQAAYEANQPDERQSLTVSATGGLFGMAFGGENIGGDAKATLTAGSTQLTSLRTAFATADTSAAKGTGDYAGAEGRGTVIENSKVITSAVASTGSFEGGQALSGQYIPAGTTIVSVEPEAGLGTVKINISKPASKSAALVPISSGTATITSVTVSEGGFEAGQTITGANIPSGTTILNAKAGSLTLSAATTGPGAGASLQAGSTKLTGLKMELGSFAVGQAIEGEGVPSGSKIVAIGAESLTIGNAATKAGSGVAISSSGPAPLAVGETVEGAGIPAGTRIDSVKADEATLSAAATATGEGVPIHAGLSADVSAARLRQALEALPTIGADNVRVSGGPGDETGAHPYEIGFVGKFENVNVPQLGAVDLSLTGGAATATVKTENDGGGGFSHGVEQMPLGGASAGEGGDPVAVSAALSGLEPDTVYHFRLVASSHCSQGEPEKLCETTGETLTLRTFPAVAAVLPDGRAYELVSPIEKHSGEVIPPEPAVGSACGYCKPGGFDNIFPMQSALDGDAMIYEGTAFDESGSSVAGNQYLARRDPRTGWSSVNVTPPQLASKSGTSGFYAVATALDRSVLGQGPREGPALSREVPTGYEDLYVEGDESPPAPIPLLRTGQSFDRSAEEFRIAYTGGSKDLSRILFKANDALTGETAAAPAAADPGQTKFNLYEWHKGALGLVNVLPGNGASASDAKFDAISEDGSRVFFSAESGQVYVRIDGSETREVQDGGAFVASSTDGGTVLLNDGCLYDLERKSCTDVTGGKGGIASLLGQGDDLTRFYFVDGEVVDEAPNGEGEFAQVGARNVYAWSAEGGTRFVARFESEQEEGSQRAEASANGRYLAFTSRASLTGYDNTGPCASNGGVVFSVPCGEVFVYDSSNGSLACVSCNRSGERPIGISRLQRASITDEGRLVFETGDSLVPADVNHGVEDVYEYEPAGVGGCRETEGCVFLISAGTGTSDSNFVAMDPNGDNVFFATRDRLVQGDKDELEDLYDARIGGGTQAEREIPAGECRGEACQPAPAPPALAAPGSLGFTGVGDLLAQAPPKTTHRSVAKPRCVRGKVRRNGHCVKKRSSGKRRGKKANRNGRFSVNHGGAK